MHCDQTASHYLKLIIDTIFCGKVGNLKNEIIWQRTRSAKQQSNSFGKITDIVFFYTKSDKHTYNKQYSPIRTEYIKSHYQNIEQGTARKYMTNNFSQAGQGEGKNFGNRYLKPPSRKHWI